MFASLGAQSWKSLYKKDYVILLHICSRSAWDDSSPNAAHKCALPMFTINTLDFLSGLLYLIQYFFLDFIADVYKVRLEKVCVICFIILMRYWELKYIGQKRSELFNTNLYKRKMFAAACKTIHAAAFFILYLGL